MTSRRNLGTLYSVLTLETDQYEKELDQARRQLEKTGKKLQGIGKSLSVGVSAPLAGIAAASVHAFGNFDAAMTKSIAIMGNVSKELRGNMSKAARDVAKTTTLSAEEAAESYFFLASAGLDAATSIKALPKVAAFAQAGAFNMARATDLLTDAQSALGLASSDTAQNIENLSRVSDVLVKANTLANASVEEFSESLTQDAGGSLKAVGKSIEEGVAVLGAFADAGTKGSAAGTALNDILLKLPEIATKNAEAFAKYNIEVFDSQGKFRNLGAIIQDFEGKYSSLSNEQKAAADQQLGLNRKIQSSINLLIGSSDQIQEYQGKLESAGGATEEVAAKQLESLNAKLGLLKSSFVDIAIAIGQQLEPFIVKLANFLSQLATKFGELSPITQKMVAAFVAFGAAIGPVLTALGAATIAIAAINPIIGGVTLGVAAAVAIWATWGDEITDFVQTAKANWPKVVADFERGIQTIIGFFESLYTESVEWVRKTVEDIGDYFTNVFEQKVTAPLERAKDKIVGVFEEMGDILVWNSVVPDMVDDIVSEFSRLDDSMIEKAEEGARGVIGIFETLSSSLGGVFGETFDIAISTGLDTDELKDAAAESGQKLIGDILGGTGGSGNGTAIETYAEGVGVLVDNSDSLSDIASNLGAYFNGSSGELLPGAAGEGTEGAYNSASAGASGSTSQSAQGFAITNTLAEVSEIGSSSEETAEGTLTAAGAAIGAYFGGESGAAIGSALGDALGGELGNLLRDDGDAAARARKEIENFIEDQIGGNVVFGGRGRFDGFEEDWVQNFQNIAGEGQAAFEAIGFAVSHLAGVSAETGAQIGYILAENLTGNLDDASLLMQQLGLRTEDLSEILNELGLEGSLSWHEIEVAQQGVNQLTDEGLVGTGDLVGAYERLVLTGGRGQVAIQALRAVAIEAGERGAETLGDLQRELISTGELTSEEIERLMQVLRGRGITSLDDLEDASTRTLGGIIADLESAGIQWGQFGDSVEGATRELTELQAHLQGIDTDLAINVRINYLTEGDPPPGIEGSALGDIFTNGAKEFAKGGVVDRATLFSFGGGSRLGVMGEAGPEAIVPLDRDERGKLGIKADGLGGTVVNFNVDARGASPGVDAEILRALEKVKISAVREAVNTMNQLQSR